MKNLKYLFSKGISSLVFLLCFSCSSSKKMPMYEQVSEKYMWDLQSQKDSISSQNVELMLMNEELELESHKLREGILSISDRMDEEQNRNSILSDYAMELEKLNEKVIYDSISRTQATRTIVKIESKLVFPEATSKSIAFFCPKEMKEETTYEVRALFGFFFENEQIKTELLSVINETRQEMNKTPISLSDIETKQVNLGTYIKIELIDPAEKFKIVFLPDNNNKPVKIFDDKTKAFEPDPYEWIWKVTPKSNSKGLATLTLSITPYDGNMKELPHKEKNYEVHILLKQGFLSSAWESANRDPKWAIATVIAPIITFFAGLVIKRRKKEDQKNPVT